MKISNLLPLLALSFAIPLGAQETKPADAKPADAKPTEDKPAATPPAVIDQDVKDKVSYAIGTQIGQGFFQDGLDVNIDIFTQAVKDAMAQKKELKYTPEELQVAVQKFQMVMMAKQQAEMSEASTRNTAAAEKFLAENGKRKEVTTTTSGLQYEVLKKGEGAKPKAEDVVTVHYHGTLVDGKVFDSSVDRGEPATFPVNGVIAGWVEALQLMPVGAKYKLFIPASLAYGDQQKGPDISPNSALIFEVELLKIEPKQ